MRLRSYGVKQDEPTTEEWRSLFKCRLQALEQATAMLNNGVALPVEDRAGWKARLKKLGRAKDGSYLASVTVLDPAGVLRVTRNVRLVKQQDLNL